jgi:heterodisulfide reductase subunit B2
VDGLNFAYYPGCTLETTAVEYNGSVLDVSKVLGIELRELPDWNCCGASSGHASDYWLSHALAGRNLAIAENMGLDVAVSCPACYLRLNDTRYEFQTKPELREKLPAIINRPYGARYQVRHILDIIRNSVGTEKVKEKVVRPLTGLKAVAYYGCYLVRPPDLTHFDDPENPHSLDNLLQALGMEVPDWRGKVECCGGSQSFTGRDTVKHLVGDIVQAAREVEAESIVTACPLCQANLETRQSGENKLPVFYFTELMGLAFGLPAGRWLPRHLINPHSLLRKHKLA